jgi:hypothetical protein
MGHLILQRDNFDWPGFSLLGESSLAITMDDPGVNGQLLDFSGHERDDIGKHRQYWGRRRRE